MPVEKLIKECHAWDVKDSLDHLLDLAHHSHTEFCNESLLKESTLQRKLEETKFF